MVSFVISIVIARLLVPEAYGVVAITNALLQIFSVFIDGGLGNALIQKKDSDDLDYSTVLITNVILCTVIYIVIYIIAPYMASFYQNNQLISLIRASGVLMLIYSVKSVLEAYISKNMMFKKFFFASLTGTVGAGVVGIIMALKGYGAWSLIISHLFDAFVDTVCMWISIRWMPSLKFSFERFKRLFSYGWKVLFTLFIERIYNKMYHFVIGKFYLSEDLAYYDKANGLTSKITDSIDGVVGYVLFPVFSNIQDDSNKTRNIARISLKMNTYVMYPLLFGVLAASESIIVVLLTKNWIATVPYLRLFCLICLFIPFDTLNRNLIKSSGKSEILLKQEIVKKIIGVTILVITVTISPLAIVIGKLLLSFISLFITAYPNKKSLDYGVLNQTLDVLPTFIISIIMAILVYITGLFTGNALLNLIVQIFVGASSYILLSILTKNESFKNLLAFITRRAAK